MKSNSSYEPRAMAGGIEGEAKRLEAQSALAWDAEYNELRQAGIEEASTVLEVGCGTGSFLKRLCEALPSTSIIGIEPDPELFEIAGKDLADQQHRAQL
ncbi:MAG TPA: class I SAM-dependent methyltransferase, partial [Acidimicrobiales bacterium]|nr:class I SAM-dependent methyltransferase [Acidimicrobiales bacterium]